MGYAVIAFAGVIVGLLAGWLIASLRANQQLAAERRKCALAEEKNFRIPILEQALTQKTAEHNQLNEFSITLRSRLTEATAKLQDVQPRLTEMAAKVGEKDWQLLQQSIQLEQSNRRCIELYRKLDEHQRAALDNLNRLDQAQRRACRDLQAAFAEVIDRPITLDEAMPSELAAQVEPAVPQSQPIPALSPEGLSDHEQNLIDEELAALDKAAEEPASTPAPETIEGMPVPPPPPTVEIPDIPRSSFAAIPIREIPADTTPPQAVAPEPTKPADTLPPVGPAATAANPAA
ncbi:MAG: hypothetical protein GX455_07885 [Phycisphaerae bacterium]|nr:hypothetical protein [Phycisphaerae bacterium]